MADPVDQQTLANDLAAEGQQQDVAPVAGDDLLARNEGDRQQQGRTKCARKEEQRQGPQRAPAFLNTNEVAGVEQPREQAEDVTGEIAGAELKAASHEQGRTEGGEGQSKTLDPRRPFAGEPQPPAGEGEAGQIAEQGRVAELGQVNADVPKGQDGSEKEGRRGNQQRELTPRPVNGLLRHGSNDEQKRQRQGQAPEPGGDWARPRQPHQPRAERQRAAADEHGRKGEWMGSGGAGGARGW